MAKKKNTTPNSDMHMKIVVIVALAIAFIGGYLIARAKYKPQIVELAKMVTDKDVALEQMKSNTNKVMMKEDKMFIVEDGMARPMDADIMMSNGDKVTTNGEISKSDGTKETMHNGDAVDMNGKKLPQITEGADNPMGY
jgi:hypothetical protein